MPNDTVHWAEPSRVSECGERWRHCFEFCLYLVCVVFFPSLLSLYLPFSLWLSFQTSLLQFLFFFLSHFLSVFIFIIIVELSQEKNKFMYWVFPPHNIITLHAVFSSFAWKIWPNIRGTGVVSDRATISQYWLKLHHVSFTLFRSVSVGASGAMTHFHTDLPKLNI